MLVEAHFHDLVHPNVNSDPLPVSLMGAKVLFHNVGNVDVQTGRLMAVPDVVDEDDHSLSALLIPVENRHLPTLQLRDVAFTNYVGIASLAYVVCVFGMPRKAAQLVHRGLVETQDRGKPCCHLELASLILTARRHCRGQVDSNGCKPQGHGHVQAVAAGCFHSAIGQRSCLLHPQLSCEFDG